jgi:glyoxylase-like metal-dependent hydrolase (beta-lactamase superfamily II)
MRTETPWLIAALLTCAAARAGSAETLSVAPGVWLIVHEDATEEWPQGNTVVVAGDRAVLVVDSAYLPSAAAADIAEIRRLTPLSVRFLLNTHWHYDHNNGNAEYRREYPDLHIVAHEATQRLMDVNAAGYGARRAGPGGPLETALQALEQQLAARQDARGAPLDEAAAAALQRNVRQRRNEIEELRALRYERPDLTFRERMTLDLGGRTVELLHLGRGNTPGDAVLYVPDARVVAPGDLLVSPIPFAFNSYPRDWVQTLRRVHALGAATLLPGHGRPQQDDRYLLQVTGLLEHTVREAHALAAQNLDLEAVRKRLSLEPFRPAFAGSDPLLNQWFDEALATPLVERAFREAKGQQ